MRVFDEFTTPNVSKWKLDSLDALVEKFEDDLFETINCKSIKDEENYLNVLIQISKKTITTIREIMVLSAHGYPDGALSLSRNLYENFIIVSFFEIHIEENAFESYVTNYFKGEEIQRLNHLIFAAKELEEGEQRIQNLNGIKGELIKTVTIRTKGDYWWAGGSNFAELVGKVEKWSPQPARRWRWHSI